MPKPVKKATKKSATPKRPSSDPNKRAGQMTAEHLDTMGQGKWANMPAPQPGEPFPSALSEYMRAIGAKGGKVSGAKRMENLTQAKRTEIAKMGARARWKAKAKP